MPNPSEIRQKLIDGLSDSIEKWCTGRSEDIADALLSLPGIAITIVPEPDDDGEWDGQDDRVGWFVANGPSIKDRCPGVLPHVAGNWLHPKAARRFAGALLAAADVAERQAHE